MADLDSLGPGLALAARLALALLFAVAGLTKLRRPHRAAKAAVDFRVVKTFTPVFGFVLGAAEVGTAVLLMLPSTSAVVGSALAGVLATGFAVISTAALLRGESFACACLFGQSRLSWSTPVRAVAMVLAAVAGGVGALVLEPVADAGTAVGGAVLALVVVASPMLAARMLRRSSGVTRAGERAVATPHGLADRGQE